ncbi:phenylalanine--tRNA ligase subunit alpha [Mycoplasma iguanae]|uniref:phenylalanine--tRNA ligase n=1 Tax=Mycoplasma iguanae TaxID=292461 RepID=A0ABY5R7P2_9MOLU|nr:phenylalanine--tRNA ligase subunit alpha [Mycoplasma iguanae]UVD81499.1 phenylalanine--tRNA ligase subunit alpha [Mycoplasma iguanae]
MDLNKINNLEDLKKIKNQFYAKDSEYGQLQEKLKTSSPEQKAQLGKALKELKAAGEAFFQLAAQKIENLTIEAKIANEKIDVEYNSFNQGSLHPLTLIVNRFRQWFLQNGYIEVEASEIETDEYNFERLNIPQNHPARDMQDSLYLKDKTLLRTHNTGVTARILEKYANRSFSQFTFGKVYRNDEDDQTHSHQFTQIDFVSVGYVNFPNLIWTLKSLLSFVLEDELDIILRPSFFPFTEPSLEVDIVYKDKTIELLGSGMLHHSVLKMAGYTNDMNGFAAGIGIERIAMIKYQILDIREFYKNDLRFLNQFK